MFIRPIISTTRFARKFATHAGPFATAPPAVLHLKTGQSYAGRSFGANKSVFGETVFSTSITSCEWSPDWRINLPLTLHF
jgi:carbamoyl-phosphate synthase small subunit